MNTSPLISIIIPTKNSSRTIEQCLVSICNQTYKNIEIIVVDNFSDDGTFEISKKYTDKVFLKGPERTTQKNFGTENSKGEYLLLIDGDMSCDEGLIEDCIEKLLGTKNGAGVCIPVVDIGSSFWTKVIAFERSFYKGTSMEAARFLRKDLVDKVGGYKHIIFYEEFIVPQEIFKLGYNVKIHSDYNLYHDYGDFSFVLNLKKKFYYGRSLLEYKRQSKELGFELDSKNQLGILHRYMLFFSNRGFYKSPFLALGVLILKTCEFGAGGIGLLISKVKGYA